MLFIENAPATGAGNMVNLPLRSSCTLEEESFPRRFPIYILMETIENFDSVYGTHNERALHAIQGILHDLRHISVEVQDVVWVVGLERSLLLLRQIYHDEISFHSIILPGVNQGILALEILMALITNYQPSVGWNHSPANADGDTTF
ncbi:hypothetical protein BJ912DRAFT_1062441 [Pholiota molesta]|nr:hypothetical protein BJ912DRAFT_1062441 [Pholiota molesta]